MNAHADLNVLPDKPYPGLRAFEAEEWAIYFGREAAAREVIALLIKRGLVLIHGASGCGKSSLVRAGVLPSLAIDHEIQGRRWRTAVMRPSEGPLDRLGAILETYLGGLAPQPEIEADEGGEADDPAEPSPATWHDSVFDGVSLVEAVEKALMGTDTSLCIVVDQFEELFRWSSEHGARAQADIFVEFLRAAGARAGVDQRLFVILTMRSDYLGHCARFDGFAEFLNSRQYLLPKIDDFGLLCAIHEPAALYGGTVEDAVADHILPMVAKEQDGLPVLQHAMMRACEIAQRRTGGEEGWRITLEDLQAIGGAENALSRHADEVLEKLIAGDPKSEEAAAWMFRALTALDADRRAIRRPCRLSELIAVSGVEPACARKVIEAFRAADCCFLSPYGPAALGPDPVIDISHEALIRRWPRISDRSVEKGLPKGWLYLEFQDGLVWRLLAVQAEAFKSDKDNILSPAAAKSRGAWYEPITRRPAWMRRHSIASDTGDGVASDAEWDAVAALMAASEKNRLKEESLITRLMRFRRWSLVLFFIFGVMVGVWSIEYYKLQDQVAANKYLSERLSYWICARAEKENDAKLGSELTVHPEAIEKRRIGICQDDLIKQMHRAQSSGGGFRKE